METKANYVIVGLFTVLAVLAAFGFVYWTAAIGDRGETSVLRIRIPGSASGLSRGSAVLFNGIKVGDVRRVYIDVTNPTVAIADADIDRLTPITKSTKADIGLAGLTGQANIELKGADPKEVNLLDEAEKAGRIAEIVANPSAVTNLLQTAQDIFKRADTVLSQLEGFTKDVRGPLTQTVVNAQKFSDALGRNADGIDKFLASVATLSDELAGVSGKLDGTLKAAEGLLNSVDKDKVKTIVGNVETFTNDLSASSKRLETIMAEVDSTAKSIGKLSEGAVGTLAKVDGTLTKVDGILENVDPKAVKDVIANIESASRTANTAAQDVAKVTAKFGERADDIDQIVSDASQLAQRLNQASVRVDGILAKLDTVLGSGEAEGLMSEASETLKAYKQVADTLNARMGTITDGLARFSGQGLRDIESLVRDSRRSITRIEQAITDLERNPQRILSGGDGAVRQFDGRTRR